MIHIFFHSNIGQKKILFTLAQTASSAEKREGQAFLRYSLVVSTAALSDIQVAMTQFTS